MDSQLFFKADQVQKLDPRQSPSERRQPFRILVIFRVWRDGRPSLLLTFNRYVFNLFPTPFPLMIPFHPLGDLLFG